MEDWYGKHYSYFQNRECEYFPCHAGANPENFSCLFCYCPLYALGDQCGGNFTYLENGVQMEDYECQICHAYHIDECGGSLVATDVNCQTITYSCSSCGYNMVKYGYMEEYHVYSGGNCIYCGAADSNAAEPEPEQPTDAPEESGDQS